MTADTATADAFAAGQREARESDRGDPLGLRLAQWWEDAIRQNNDAGMAVRRLEGDPNADPPKPRTGTDAEIAAARAENLRWWAAAEQRHRDLCLYVERGIVPAGFEVTT